MKKRIKDGKKDYFYMTLGTLLAAAAINTFFASHNLVFGGVSGLAIVIEYLFGLRLSTINLLLNIPLFLFGAKLIGRQFLIRSIYATTLLSVFLQMTDFLRTIQTDLIVSAIFGGVLLGIGVGIVLKSGGSTGGSDMLALIMHQHIRLPVSFFIFVIDTTIIITGVIIFGVNRALYAIVVVFFISRTVNETMKRFEDVEQNIMSHTNGNIIFSR